MKEIMSSVVVDKQYYDSLENYKPRNCYRNSIETKLPIGWRIKSSGVWQFCYPTHSNMPLQGWKIHISGTMDNALEIIKKASEILIKYNTPFKFTSDSIIFEMMNSKGWSRGGSGKLITIYPNSTEQCGHLLEELYAILKNFTGPYILSDRRYKDCKVLFYRYGGFQLFQKQKNDGKYISQIVDPYGKLQPDKRTPFFSLPNWVKDPFNPEENVQQKELSLKNGAYHINTSLAFSNTGGVYEGVDVKSGRSVIIKEARPYTGTNKRKISPTDLLCKEYRLLKTLKHTNVTAKPIDSFQEWEHSFIVQEKLKGLTLNKWLSQNSVALNPTPDTSYVQDWFNTVITIFLELTKAIQLIHESNIVFGDLSPTNIIIEPENLSIKLIDFEGACELGVDKSPQLSTPGYASQERNRIKDLSFEDDYFSLGAIFLSAFFPVSILSSFKGDISSIVMENFRNDFNVPQELCQLIIALMDEDSTKRPSLEKVREKLEGIQHLHKETCSYNGNNIPSADIAKWCDIKNGLIEHTLNLGRYQRYDRVFPCDWQYTNPLSVDHGALGIAHTLNYTNHDLPNVLYSWIEQHYLNIQSFVPGLYNGLAGMGWVLQDLGKQSQAEKVLDTAYNHPLLYEKTDLYSGAAGVGLALCNHFLETGNIKYLGQAQNIATTLINMSQVNEKGLHWISDTKGINIGYAKGGSGISMFFLTLYKLTNNDQFLNIGERALSFDLAFSDRSKGFLSFPERSDNLDVLLPYWFAGTAGIGTALLRYYSVTKKPIYKQLLQEMLPDLSRKYTIFPGLFKGLTGIGNFLLDYHQVFEDPVSLKICSKVLNGLEIFMIKEDHGYIFPGNHLYRKSTDFATGSMGISAFIHRFITREHNYNFTMDSLLLERTPITYKGKQMVKPL